MQKKIIQVNGKEVFLAIRNPKAKKVMIFLHGLGGSHMGLEKLAKKINLKNYRLIIFDLPGHNLSDKLDAEHDIKNYSLFLKDLLEELEIDNCTIMGHCLGAQIAIDFENRFPERTEKLILITPIPKKVYLKGKFSSLYYFVALILPNPLKRSWLIKGSRLIRSIIYMYNDQESKDEIYEMTEKELKNLNEYVITDGFKSILKAKTEDQIEKIRSETLIIISKKDFIFPSEEIYKMYKKISKVKFEILQLKHVAVFEEPDEIAKIISNWQALKI